MNKRETDLLFDAIKQVDRLHKLSGVKTSFEDFAMQMISVNIDNMPITDKQKEDTKAEVREVIKMYIISTTPQQTAKQPEKKVVWH